MHLIWMCIHILDDCVAPRFLKAWQPRDAILHMISIVAVGHVFEVTGGGRDERLDHDRYHVNEDALVNVA